MSFKPAKSLDTISASEVGQWVYCHQAWYLARLGAEHRNQQALIRGVRHHERHGRQVAAAETFRRIALLLMLLASWLLALALFLFLR